MGPPLLCNEFLTLVTADPKLGEQHIYRKYFKFNSFQLTTDLSKKLDELTITSRTFVVCVTVGVCDCVVWVMLNNSVIFIRIFLHHIKI